jgi:hypothetical protein
MAGPSDLNAANEMSTRKWTLTLGDYLPKVNITCEYFSTTEMLDFASHTI